MYEVLGSLNDNARRVLQVSVCGTPWTLHLTKTSYCCVMRKGKDMSRVKHDWTLYPCIQCFVYKEYISQLARIATRYGTVICDAYNKSIAFLDVAVVLQRRAQNITARK